MTKSQYHNGYKFNRDEKTGYYMSTCKINGKRRRLHRYVWECEFGEIPEGFHIHHIDHNKDNNDISNLELLSAFNHMSYHARNLTDEQKEKLKAHLDKIRSKANEWHHSKEAKEIAKRNFDTTLKPILEEVHIKTCEVCKKEYKVNGTTKHFSRFCSNKCKSAYRRKLGKDNIVVCCAVCGNTFTKNKYAKTKTCSKKCGWVIRRENSKNKKD